jgi:hypothetical protein
VSEVIAVELFVAALGASNYTYAEATSTQQVPDWVASHQRAFQFFGGGYAHSSHTRAPPRRQVARYGRRAGTVDVPLLPAPLRPDGHTPRPVRVAARPTLLFC